jgi:hypothetical protein
MLAADLVATLELLGHRSGDVALLLSVHGFPVHRLPAARCGRVDGRHLPVFFPRLRDQRVAQHRDQSRREALPGANSIDSADSSTTPRNASDTDMAPRDPANAHGG